MTAKTNHWKLGLFVMASLAVGLGALLWFGANSLLVEKSTVYAVFNESVNGLEVGSPVKYRGVTIGSVADISFAPDRTTVIVDIDILYAKLRAADLGAPGGDLPEWFAVQLASAGITGGKFIRADLFDPDRFPRQPAPESWPEHVDIESVLPSVVSSLKNLEESVLEIAEGLPRAIDDVGSLIVEIKAISKTVRELADGQITDILNEVSAELSALDVEEVQRHIVTILEDVQPAVRNVGEITTTIRENRSEINRLVAKAGDLAAALEQAIIDADVKRTTADMRGAIVSADEAASEATRVSRDVKMIIEEGRRSLADLNQTLASIQALADLLERDPGVLLRGRQSPSSSPRNP